MRFFSETEKNRTEKRASASAARSRLLKRAAALLFAVALIAAELPAIALAETTDAAVGINGAAVPAEAASTDGQAQGNALGSSTGETDSAAGTPGLGTDPSDGTGTDPSDGTGTDPSDTGTDTNSSGAGTDPSGDGAAANLTDTDLPGEPTDPTSETDGDPADTGTDSADADTDPAADDGTSLEADPETAEDLDEELLEEEPDLTAVLNGAAKGTLKTGVYSIASTADPSYVLMTEGASLAKKANVCIGEDTGAPNQLYYVAALGGGKYRIENLNSGMVLDSAGGETAKGTNIQQYKVNSTAAQTFKITEGEAGLYTIAATHCSLVLDIAKAEMAEGTNVRLWKSNNTAAQKWVFTKVMDPVSTGTYTLVNAGTGKAMQVKGRSASNKANIETADQSDDVSQRFCIRSTDGGATYKIINLYSRKTLDVAGGSKASGANIQQYKINGTAAQTFRVIPLGDGNCRISAMSGSLPLTVSGSNVCQANPSGAEDQVWTLTKAPVTPAEGMYRILSAKDSAYGLDIYGGDWNIKVNVQLYTKSTKTSQVNQQFTLTDAGDGGFTITNVGSGKVLDKAGGAENMANENVQQYKPNGTGAQTWYFEDTGAGDGSYYIRNGVGTYLDIAGGKVANATNIQSHRGNKTAAQKWYLEPTSFSGTGWRTVNTYERSYYKDGSKLTGWNKIGSYYYYFDSKGIMAYNTTIGAYDLDSRGRRHAATAESILKSVKPGGKTVKNLLQNALIPCGRVLYIWGGGWDGSDSCKIGYLSSWGTFFKSHATKTYDRNLYRYSYGSGLDCSGYTAWVVYNTVNTKNNQKSILYENGVSYNSTKLAKRVADLGYATYTVGAPSSYSKLKPGDIVSMDGHVWIFVGACSDGSGVMVHSSPMGLTYGGGVQLAGTLDKNGNRNSEGYRLAKAYMEKYFPYWPYTTNVAANSYRTSAVGYARWKNDPDKIKSMSAEQVLKLLLGDI